MTFNAAIYSITRQKAPFSQIIAQLGISKSTPNYSFSDSITQTKICWANYAMTLNVMPSVEIPNHINGFCGYINYLQQYQIRGKLASNSEMLISQLLQTRQVLGIGLNPDQDKEGKGKQLILQTARYLDGVIFSNNSVYDSKGELLIGPKETYSNFLSIGNIT